MQCVRTLRAKPCHCSQWYAGGLPTSLLGLLLPLLHRLPQALVGVVLVEGVAADVAPRRPHPRELVVQLLCAQQAAGQPASLGRGSVQGAARLHAVRHAPRCAACRPACGPYLSPPTPPPRPWHPRARSQSTRPGCAGPPSFQLVERGPGGPPLCPPPIRCCQWPWHWPLALVARWPGCCAPWLGVRCGRAGVPRGNPWRRRVDVHCHCA